MSLRSWLRDRVRQEPAVDEVRSGREEDTGGSAGAVGSDRNSTTGATPSDVFVGRAGGDDPGYLDTGAERRSSTPASTPEPAADQQTGSDIVSRRACPNCGDAGPHEKYGDSGDVFRCAACGHAVTDPDAA